MKLVLLLMAAMTFTTSPDLSVIRSAYTKAPSEEKYCRQLIESLKNIDETKSPLLGGYKGCAAMIMAKHVFNPFMKLSYFNKGKRILEKAIETDKSNVELRYLRFTVQTNSPSFLGYKKDMPGDRAFLVQMLPVIDDTYLRNAITKALN